MNRYFLFWLVGILSVCGFGAMCEPKPITPTPVVDAGPPLPTVDAAPSPPAPSVVVDAGPAPSVLVDAGPAPAVVDWLECGPEGIAAMPTVKRKLGARMLPHPARMLAPKFLLAARTVFWDPLNPIPLDQGNVGRCTGYSADECLSTKPFSLVSTSKRGDDLYHWATVLDNFVGTWLPDDTGSDCESAARAAVKLGLIVGYDVAYTLADIKSRLTMGPGVFCSNWSTPQFTPDHCGLVHYDPARIEGGHARALVGLNVELKRVAERNTWGPKYGVRRHGATGYFQETWDDIQRELDDGGVAVFYRLP